MIELEKYARKAADVLGHEGLGRLCMYAFNDGSYRCPLLWHTAKGKDTATGAIFLQDWYAYNRNPTNPEEDTTDFKKEREYVAMVQKEAGHNDRTLDPLFRSQTWQKRFEDGWVATNAIWGLRPPGRTSVTSGKLVILLQGRFGLC
jgi:hypothetical protein